MTIHSTVRFAVIGLNHPHIYGQANALLGAGAELVVFYAEEDDLAAAFAGRYPQARRTKTIVEILEDETIHLMATAAIPDERARLGIAAMRHGKDVFSDKPGFVTLDDLDEARRVQAETGQIYAVFFSERFGSRATVKASELVYSGTIGRVVQTIGMGPHRVGNNPRAPWFYEARRSGGVLNDLASHQIDQFLHFTGSDRAEIASAHIANVHHPQYPHFEDVGDLTLKSDRATGFIRVDWLTPDGLDVWGDVRLFLLGTEGTIELRKNTDLAGRPGDEHLFLIDARGVSYVDCRDVPLPFGAQFVADILHRTETAVSQAHTFHASELAVRAQADAVRLTSRSSQ